LLTFGLNGAVAKVKRGEEYFKGCYRELIEAVRQASPNTRIILGSCFPVAENMDMTNYSVTLDGLNGCIETLNCWTLELCSEEGLRYLNVNEVLTDGRGRLKLEYQAGDGHHLTAAAYVKILEYIRTHGYR
jgi:lysophospholipase L1-like esterase